MIRLTPRQIQDKINFIKDYVQARNAASASTVDANANVTEKNIATLQSELYKDFNIQINRALIKERLANLFDADIAEQYEKDLESHLIYCHDESSLSPYTYSARETIAVIYQGAHLLLSYEDLYALVDTPEVALDEVKGVWGKYPTDLKVYDRGGNTVAVTRLVKKVRHRDLVRVKTAFGEDVYVTDNHPMITAENPSQTVEARNSKGHLQYRTASPLQFGGKSSLDSSVLSDSYNAEFTLSNGYRERIDSCHRQLHLTEDFGYFVGMFVAEGHYIKLDGEVQGICITQDDPGILVELSGILYRATGAASKIRRDTLPPSQQDRTPKHRLEVPNRLIGRLFFDYFKIHDYAQNKNLPYNALEFTPEFVRGMIAGICDGDGSLHNDLMLVRVASRQLISQLTTLLPYFGYSVGNSISLPNASPTSYITTQYPMFGVSFSKRSGSAQLRSFKMAKACIKTASLKYATNHWVSVTNVQPVENQYFLDQNKFIYDITTESGTFIMNNLWVHNCVSISMYPFLLNGMEGLGGESQAPKHLESFCGSFGNLAFAISAQFAGALATPEFLMFFDYFARKDYGDNYLENPETCKWIEQKFQHVIYVIAQPATARGYQSIFWNVSLFDKYFFKHLFKDFIFPDGTKPVWASVERLQRMFMRWLREERKRALLTFPVVTLSALTDGTTWKDQSCLEWAADEYAQGSEFFIYTSQTVDSLSSCCFSGSQKVLTRSSQGVKLTTFAELDSLTWDEARRNLQVFHSGSWVKGKLVKIPGATKQMFRVVTANNKELILTEDHINPTLGGDKPTRDLTTDDYLLANTQPLPGRSQALTYDEGVMVGAYLGDGSKGTRVALASGETKIYEINLSMNDEKVERLLPFIQQAVAKYGAQAHVAASDGTKLTSVRISCAPLVQFIQQWVTGDTCDTKQLSLGILEESVEFRKGVLDGWYATDGGNSNRCYTTSSQLVDTMEALVASLGMHSIINVSDRTDEPVVIRGETFKRNFPLYCFRWYSPNDKRVMPGIYRRQNNSVFFKIKSIEEVPSEENVYCFEVNPDEPYFTLPNGIITHNCRLRNPLKENTFSYSMGAGGVMTGSKNVITINMNRLVQQGHNLADVIDRVHKYQVCFEDLFQWFFKANLLTVYQAGFIDLKKQFLTLGINGIVEAAESLGYEITNNEAYKSWLVDTLKVFKEKNKEAGAKYHLMFNTEVVPAENLGIKNAKWDKKSGLKVQRDCYNSYFYRVEDASLSLFDKMELHGGEVLDNLDGGSALHFNNDEKLTPAQYRKVFESLAVTGSNYFCENCRRTICKTCGYIHPFTSDHCVKCGSTDIEYAVRIIGYLKRISNFSEARQAEAGKRYYHKGTL